MNGHGRGGRREGAGRKPKPRDERIGDMLARQAMLRTQREDIARTRREVVRKRGSGGARVGAGRKPKPRDEQLEDMGRKP